MLMWQRYQTASTSAAETHKADADRRLSILEGKADVTHDVCVKTLASLTQLTHQMSQMSQQQPVSNQTATYPQPSVSAPIPMIPSGPAPQFQAPQFQGQTQQAPWNAYQAQQQQQQQYQAPSQWQAPQPYQGKGAAPYAPYSHKGGKGERRGKGDRLCYICKMPGHIARFCPHKDPQARQYVGRQQAQEAGRQFVAAVETYEQGGTSDFAPQDLHDQMGDGEGVIAAVDIMHVASTLASELTGQHAPLPTQSNHQLIQVQSEPALREYGESGAHSLFPQAGKGLVDSTETATETATATATAAAANAEQWKVDSAEQWWEELQGMCDKDRLRHECTDGDASDCISDISDISEMSEEGWYLSDSEDDEPGEKEAAGKWAPLRCDKTDRVYELSGGTFDQKFYECDEQEFHECEELSARQTRRKQHDNKARK